MINNEIKLKENARDLSDTESDENLKEFTKGVVQQEMRERDDQKCLFKSYNVKRIQELQAFDNHEIPFRRFSLAEPVLDRIKTQVYKKIVRERLQIKM